MHNSAATAAATAGRPASPFALVVKQPAVVVAIATVVLVLVAIDRSINYYSKWSTLAVDEYPDDGFVVGAHDEASVTTLYPTLSPTPRPSQPLASCTTGRNTSAALMPHPAAPARGDAPPELCVLYKARFKTCLELQRDSTLEEKLAAFAPQSFTSAKEVVLLRLTPKWSPDYWLNVCSVMMEARRGGTRDVRLIVLRQEMQATPPEFQPFVWVQDEEVMKRVFTEPVFRTGWFHGDLVASFWAATENPQYEFYWLMEVDVRFTGDWDVLFAYARAYGRNTTSTTVARRGDGCNPDNDVEAWHVVHYSDNITREYRAGQEADVIAFDSIFWDSFGVWQFASGMMGDMAKNTQGRKYLGFVTVLFGMTRRMAVGMFDYAFRGNAAGHQEGNIGATADALGMKVVQVPMPRHYCVTANSAVKVYSKWRGAECCMGPHLFHPVKL